MKRLHKLIISTYLGPFILTFFITLFILVMQFLWKYIDEMVGKGLEWYVIGELLFYASANLVPLALPLAVLLSSIMTFGSMGEKYELVAMKSAGLSLQRIMFPLIVFILFLSAGAFYFSNNIWPVANLKFASLLYDIRQKKPALDIKEKVPYKDIEGFVIRVNEKSEDGQTLKDIVIYDHSDRSGNNKVVRAEEGNMKMSDDERYLILTLTNGNSYEQPMQKKKAGKKNQKREEPFFRSSFEKDIVRFDLTGFNLERSNEDIFKDNYQMLNLSQLEEAIDTLNIAFGKRDLRYRNQIKEKLRYYEDSLKLPSSPATNVTALNFLDTLDAARTNAVYETSKNIARAAKTYVRALKSEHESRKTSVWRHQIEWHRKFTLSIACIVLFFIGAPLGAIIRKGGLGLPVVVSVLFFLVFHVFSITGEKMVKQGTLPPMEGMWLATAVLIPIGIFLTYKATTDSVILDAETYYKFFEKIKRLLGKDKTA